MALFKSGSNLLRVGGSSVLSQAADFPPGVSLTEIDGGDTYYADSGHTYAADAGWDDPDFFPISIFLEKFSSSGDATRWNNFGLNTALAVQGDVNNSLMQSNGTFLIVQAGEWLVNGGNNLFHMTLGTNCVGINAFDEPPTYTDAISALQNFPNTGANGGQDGRFWYENYTITSVIHFDISGHTMPDLLNDLIATPNATTRHLDLIGVDVYFFAGFRASFWQESVGQMYALGRDATQTEMRRGCRYTDLCRFIRLDDTNPSGDDRFQPDYPAPMGVYVETGTPYTENTTIGDAIRAAELNAAVWGCIIGGARMIKYFSLGEGAFATGIINDTFWDTARNGDAVSMTAQITSTNALIQSLASVINSPFAVGYASVSPAPVMLTSSVADSGFDFMVKYYNRGASADNRFYIFAIPRFGEGTTNQTATFTIPNTGASQVTVINESRTISVTAGGTQFQDTFADHLTVHIYRVDD